MDSRPSHVASDQRSLARATNVAHGRGPAAPWDGRPDGSAIHATAVALGGSGLLILGPSGAGKSRLAAALIASSTKRRPIRLVGDDRILLKIRGGRPMASPHPRIAGFLERRGFGIVAYPFEAPVPLCGVVSLAASSLSRIEAPSGPTPWVSTTLQPPTPQNFRGLPSVNIDRAQAVEVQRDAVLRWWRDACTTPGAKTPPRLSGRAKDWNW